MYAFWAELLDFRTELLGEELTQAMEEHWGKTLRERQGDFLTVLENKENTSENDHPLRVDSGESEEMFSSTSSSTNGSEAQDFASAMKTPRPPTSGGLLRFPSRRWTRTPDDHPSPSLYSLAETKTSVPVPPTSTRPPSMFERALGSFLTEDTTIDESVPSDLAVEATPQSIATATATATIRRKWGSQTILTASLPGMISPAVRNLAPEMQRKPTTVV